MAIERRFLRGAIDKLGVDFQVAKRHEYKSAAEQLTERASPAPPGKRPSGSRAPSPGRSPARRRAQADRPGAGPRADRHRPVPWRSGAPAGLVDELGYRDEVYAASEADRPGRHPPVPRPLSACQRLAERARKLPAKLPAARERSVALIYATGPIRRGRSGRSPLSGGAMGSDTIAASIRSAVADEQVRAIVLRVNSPGGSYVASDTIWREVVRARTAGKPVVVSMGDVAASGGYFISMAADVIVAQPGTVTGSIGVLSGKAVVGQLLERIGVTTDSVTKGAHSAMFSLAARSARANGRWSTTGSTTFTPTSPARSRTAAGCPTTGCTSWPGVGCGPAPTRRSTGSSTRSAASTGPLRSPAAGRACRVSAAARVPRVRPLDRLRQPSSSASEAGVSLPERCSRKAGGRSGGWRPGGLAAVRPADPARQLDI